MKQSALAIITSWLILIAAIACITYLAFKSDPMEMNFTLNLFVLSFSFLAILVCSSFLFWNKTAKAHNKYITTLYITPYLWLVILTILSIIAIPFLKIKLESQDVTNFYTAFIALCTTFVVGFQIYNSIELTKKIEDLNSKNSDLEKKWLERQQAIEKESKAQRDKLIEEINNAKKIITQNNYFNAYNMATTRYTLAFSDRYQGDKRLCWNSLRSYFFALKYAAEGGHDFQDSLSAIEPKIKKCIDELSRQTDPDMFHRINYYRARYIRDINLSIEDTISTLENSDKNNSTTIARFKDLQKNWDQFLKIFDTES